MFAIFVVILSVHIYAAMLQCVTSMQHTNIKLLQVPQPPREIYSWILAAVVFLFIPHHCLSDLYLQQCSICQTKMLGFVLGILEHVYLWSVLS